MRETREIPMNELAHVLSDLINRQLSDIIGESSLLRGHTIGPGSSQR
jgi:hypothetical protein